MNKKLVALAVGSALGLAPVVAPQAKVTVYGHAQVEIASEDTGATDIITVEDNARGRLGVKASEKLGNGMTAIAKFEWKLDTTQGGAPVTSGSGANREAFVGLKGNFGTVELGNLKSAYKYSGGVGYDAFVATNLEARGTGGMSKAELGNSAFGHNSFLSDSIGYKSANFNGLSFWATFSPDESLAGVGSDGDYSFAINYQNGPFEVGVAGVNNDDAAGGDGFKFYGKYKWGNHTFLGQYETLDDKSGVTADIDIWFLGYQMKAGNNTFVAQFGNNEVDNATGSDTETDYFALGVIHSLSKKTRIFGGFRNTDAGSGSETDVVSVGLRVIF